MPRFRRFRLICCAKYGEPNAGGRLPWSYWPTSAFRAPSSPCAPPQERYVIPQVSLLSHQETCGSSRIMGRPYATELCRLSETYSWAREAPIEPLVTALSAAQIGQCPASWRAADPSSQRGQAATLTLSRVSPRKPRVSRGEPKHHLAVGRFGGCLGNCKGVPVREVRGGVSGRPAHVRL